MSSKCISADQVYQILKPFKLTTEQREAVELAPTDAPALVVAGAGSGKTELMSVRVLWLVANQICRPDQILGLTFTRKAANELNRRIYEGLIKLRESELWPEQLDYDFTPPTISTYNSYANRVFRDWAMPLGYDENVRLLSEAGAFQLAREVVLKDGPTLDSRIYELDSSPNELVEAVLSLNQQMLEHSSTAEQISEAITGLVDQLEGLPQKTGSTNTSRFDYLDKLINPVLPTPIVAGLAEAYQSRKQELGLVDFADQVALAARAAREIPQASSSERDQFDQILLDEYQDTSVLQTRFLAKLFTKKAVFAVGDPNQSIYGWRGASAANLSNFFDDFSAPTAARFNLSTSWRNPVQVLTLANQLLGDLRVLELAPAKSAELGSVEISVSQTLQEEADRVAEWFAARVSPETSAALLLRKRANMASYVRALEKKGLAVEVVGLGGLLDYPEITDLVAALKVIGSADAGSELIRLLAGPRWRIGPLDLQRLARFANRLNKRYRGQLSEVQLDADAFDQISIVEALDELPEYSRPETLGFSEIALVRLKDAALTFRSMRRRSGIGLANFVTLVAEELWLDIEVQANPQRSNPLAQLSAFYEVARNFADASHRTSLSDFVGWLEFAAERERFEVPEKSAQLGVVQVLTAHAAKGLEWDYVAVGNLVDGDFPDSPSAAARGWLKTGAIPFELRGDGSALPKLEFSGITTQPEAKKEIERFFEANRQNHRREELRLAYVAFTRPKRELMLAASYWKPNNKQPRELSAFLIAAAEQLNQTLPLRAADENPLAGLQQTQTWPLDPLGATHRQNLMQAAAEIRSKMDDLSTGDRSELVDLLLAEREERLSKTVLVDFPVRIPASKFSDFVTDLDLLAELARRPLPSKPYRASRTGTLFHSWLESKFKTKIDLENDRFGDLGDDFELLVTNFESSEWATRIPLSVEQEIQLTIGQTTFICKLDAVYETKNGYEIVDWKTGRQPKTEAERQKKDWQLALYRWAFARSRNIPIGSVSASIYYVADDLNYRPADLPDEAQILAAWNSVLEKLVV